ncbi:CGNR zinc finger domain-containing protein [Mycobacterium sp. BMJ-28]
MIEDSERSGAPEGLEDVRTLLNSWHIPNDTRIPRDDLSSWLDDGEFWYNHFEVVPFPRRGIQARKLRVVRDAIRALVNGDPHEFDALLIEQPPTITVRNGQLEFISAASASSRVMSLVLDAAAGGTLPRLRTCLDCGWAFYDSSRNNRRRWCAMSPSPRGRGCGSAAKARTYRARSNQ